MAESENIHSNGPVEPSHSPGESEMGRSGFAQPSVGASGFTSTVGVEEGSHSSSVKGLMGNSRFRLFAIVGLIIVIIAWFSAYKLVSHPTTADKVSGKSELVRAPTVSEIPGTSKSNTYNQKLQQSNVQGAQQARNKGQSFLPSLTAAPHPTTFNVPMSASTAPSTPAAPTPVATTPVPVQQSPQQVAMQQQQEQQHQVQVQAENQAVADNQKIFDSQVAFYLGLLRKDATIPSYEEFKYNGATPKTTAPTSSSGTTNASTSDTASVGSKEPSLIRAGTVVPAVLLTGINSDTPGPVMAEITSGPLKGARVLGSAVASRDTMRVEFHQLVLPPGSTLGSTGTLAIDAFAVDPNLKVNVATSVNHHYLHNYALLAAAALISGYGQAASEANSTSSIGPLGNIITTNNGLTSKQINEQAIGQVGTQLGEQLSQSAQIPPTVKTASGTAVGLLFVSGL